MSDIKHTPGPWIVTHDGRLIEAEYREGYVASVSFYDSQFCGPEDEAEAAANAFLIAAAPELLEALKAARSAWLAEANSGDGVNEEQEPILAQVDAAIAKAEGKP